MTVCALIVTYRRPELLKRCLESLAQAALATPSEELSYVILVNGTDQESAALARGFSIGRPARVMELEQRISPAAARNLALTSPSDAEWVFFMDDDAFVPPDYLRKFGRAVAESPEAAVIGGPNLTPSETSLIQKATGVALSSRFATYLSVARYRSEGSTRSCGEEALMLCNLFVRKDCLGDKPFPENFVCAEENWFLQGAARRGLEMKHVPELSVFHERRPTLSSLALQVFRYGFGRGQNIRSRPLTFRPAHVLPAFCLLYSIAWLFWDLSSIPFLVYAGLGLVCAHRACQREKQGWEVGTTAFAVFPIIHIQYGAGILFGLALGRKAAS